MLRLLAILTMLISLTSCDKMSIGKNAEAQEPKIYTNADYFKDLVPLIPDLEKQVECMAMNIYHEARSESEEGKIAVAMVTMNRKENPQFPNTICGVVQDARYSRWHKDNTGKAVPLKDKCQFSWFCDGKEDSIYEPDKYEAARAIAVYVMSGYNRIRDVTQGAMWYHADYVSPSWRKKLQKTTKIGRHIFYKEPVLNDAKTESTTVRR